MPFKGPGCYCKGDVSGVSRLELVWCLPYCLKEGTSILRSQLACHFMEGKRYGLTTVSRLWRRVNYITAHHARGCNAHVRKEVGHDINFIINQHDPGLVLD